MNKLVDAYMETLPPLEPAPPVPTIDEAITGLDERQTMAEEQIVLLRSRIGMLEENQQQMAVNMLTMLEHLKAIKQGQSTDGPQSSIILPDHFH